MDIRFDLDVTNWKTKNLKSEKLRRNPTLSSHDGLVGLWTESSKTAVRKNEPTVDGIRMAALYMDENNLKLISNYSSPAI